MPLSDFTLIDLPEVAYSSDEAEINADIYERYLPLAVRYDRLSGYFSSTVFLLTRPSLRDFFLERGGQMRLICSPRLSAEDATSILQGYSSDGAEERAQLREMLEDPDLRAPTQLLATLVATKHLEMKIAEWKEREVPAWAKAMFHEKVGCFIDSAGHAVGFRGSFNETFMGLSGNIESTDVWPSWLGDRDAERVAGFITRFDRLFDNEADRINVRPLPPGLHEDLVRIGEEVSLEEAFEFLENQNAPQAPPETPTLVEVQLRPHQKAALETWIDEGHQGILEHATGAGKTITGLEMAKVAAANGLGTLVLVPSAALLHQWSGLVEEILGWKVLKCGDGHDSWKDPGVLRETISGASDGSKEIIVAVMDTARSDRFLGLLKRSEEKLLLIADEVHRMGSPENLKLLNQISPRWRVGLSATPARAGDPQGTEALFEFFGDVIHRYSLRDGIDDGYLTEYMYFPHVVRLTDDEQSEWEAQSKKISEGFARLRDTDSVPFWLKIRIMKRAQIAKSATRKIERASDIVMSEYEPGQRWLVYCADLAQLSAVRDQLRRAGIETLEYHQAMTADRKQTFAYFAQQGGVMVAIKCLDEGVDIPAASHALILASSQNPREFVQRRGRILRKSPRKTHSTLIDVLVVPQHPEEDSPRSSSLVLAEVARALEFGERSLNRTDTRAVLSKVLQEMAPDRMDVLTDVGIETDDE